MYGLGDLKGQLRVSEDTVECPVLGCTHTVARQRRRFSAQDRFSCPAHGICISPSTWKYRNKNDNLLWKAPSDLDLLRAIEHDKRESRMAFDNSEDAVTFNVFRCLELHPDDLAVVLGQMAGEHVNDAELVYWSHHAKTGQQWEPLNRARKTFERVPARGSEPDLIVITDEILFFIEAKLTSTNVTTAPKSGAQKDYLTGAGGWFARVFDADWQTIAVTGRRYELLRFWLLGTWLAAQLGVKFCLVSLVPSRQVTPSRHEPFENYVRPGDDASFCLYSWEQVRDCLRHGESRDSDTHPLATYFATKTIGYGSDRRLKAAFNQ